MLALVCEYFHRGWWLHSQLRLISEKFSWVSFKGFEVQSVAGVLDVILGCLLLDSEVIAPVGFVFFLVLLARNSVSCLRTQASSSRKCFVC